MSTRLVRAIFVSAAPAVALVAFGQLLGGSLARGGGSLAGGGVGQDDGEVPKVVIPSSPAVPEGDATVDGPISAEELRGHVQALSSDELQGRPMGSPEILVAAKYCADRLEAMGARPGGLDGSYYQPIELAKVSFEGIPELNVVASNGDSATLLYGAGFSFQSASAPLPTGKLRCVFVEEEEQIPAEADPTVALVMATSAGKARRWLRDAGHASGAGFGLVVIPRKGSKPRVASKPRDYPMRPLTSARGTINTTLSGEWADRTYAGELATVELIPKAKVETQIDVNVLGVIPGVGTEEHPELANEVVILSAHRDHIGTLRVRDGAETPDDVIRNGADDDASGCATVLEIAEAIAQGEPPVRTLIVSLVTGEEVGFVGSSYWVAHPTVPIESVVCAISFEMLGRPDDLAGGAGNIWLTGDERSDLGPKLREKGCSITADVRPEQNFFARSDNVPYARAGIVSQSISSYGGHRDYHQPSDEWDTLDYDHMQAAVSRCLKAVRVLISDVEWTPAWNEGQPKF